MLAKFPGKVAALDGAPARRGPDPVADATGGPHHPAPRDFKAIEARLQRGDTARALAEGQRLALMFPALGELHNLLGIAFGKAGKLEDAVRACRRTAGPTPGDAGVRLNMANALMALGRFGEAADAAGAALAAELGMGPAVVALRGVALAQAGRHEEAEAAFRKLIRLAPDRPEGHLGLSYLLAATGRREAALDAYQAARACDPDNPEVPGNVGATLAGLGRLDEAIAEMEPALARHPRHLSLRTNLAKALRDAGAVDRVLEVVAGALDSGQESGELWARRSACLKELGEIEGATVAMARAGELAPGALELLTMRSQTAPVPLDRPDYARIAELVETETLPPGERARLGSALSTAHDAADETEIAFAWLARGNAFWRAAQPYDFGAQARILDALAAPFRDAAPVLSTDETEAIPAHRLHRRNAAFGHVAGRTDPCEPQSSARRGRTRSARRCDETDRLDRRSDRGRPDARGPHRLRRAYIDGIATINTDAPVDTEKCRSTSGSSAMRSPLGRRRVRCSCAATGSRPAGRTGRRTSPAAATISAPISRISPGCTESTSR